ncbi:anti-sigma B factor antagonist [Desulfonatronum thiosulfatophilum]|uniref:Anti-sigma factor antagonist n=1 Tax=Desulfonatronum thiosulfatophilum TaxID=617002 RepID=A0A1G6AJ20_9BACT|nr:STAS domain-containing protein [Desulfonatronum thiosulfatophilum]SDB08397.1 anti-sigma B factor antagonist [Desulfonatronum thiosulfatophilum]
MEIKENSRREIVVFTLQGRLDGNEAQAFEERVLIKLDQGATKLVFDFHQLDYINSSGLRVLVMTYQRLQAANGRIAICGLKDYIQEIFDISGYNEIFAMYADCDAALRELQDK